MLEQYRSPGALPEDALGRLTTLAARLFQVPVPFVSLIDGQRQFFVSRHGLNISGTARKAAFCDYTLAQGDILCVPDTFTDPRFRDNPLAQGYPHIRFYAGIPLLTPDEHCIGTVFLTDTQPRPALTDTDRQHLADIDALIMDRMEVQRLELLRHASQQRLQAMPCGSVSLSTGQA